MRACQAAIASDSKHGAVTSVGGGSWWRGRSIQIGVVEMPKVIQTTALHRPYTIHRECQGPVKFGALAPVH